MLIERFEISLLVQAERDPMRNSPARGSLMHGLLMAQVKSDLLHDGKSSVRPYSQFIASQGDRRYTWVINTLESQAAKPLTSWLERIPNELYLHHYDVSMKVEHVEKTQSISYDQLMDFALSAEPPKFISLELCTPTAFKRAGQTNYFLWPDPRLIAQSALNRWNSFAGPSWIEDDGLLDEIAAVVSPQSFNLQTRRVAMDGISFSATTGRIGFLIQRNTPIRQAFNLCALYSQYCGLGIKTAMGLGAVRHHAPDASAVNQRRDLRTVRAG